MTSPIDRLTELAEMDDQREKERQDVVALSGVIIEALPDALIVTNGVGEIVLCNENAQLMFGRTRGELLGLKVEALIPEGLRDSHRAHRVEFVRTGLSGRFHNMGFGAGLTAQHTDGSEFVVSITIARLVAQSGVFGISLIRYATAEQPRARPDMAEVA